MTRKFFLVLSIWLLIMLFQPNSTNAEKNIIDNRLLLDTLVTLLNPYISGSLEHYYGYHKSYGLHDIKILDISREEKSEFSFTVKIQVNTFDEAHNPPYGKETIILEVDVDKVRVIKFIHEGDVWERKITDFYNEAISDILQSFKLNLTSFNKLNYEQLMFKSEKQMEYKSLSDIVTEIIDDELTTEINTPYNPYKNVIAPVTFIKGHQGYILFKKADGTNIVIEVFKLNDKWVVVNKESKQGMKMKYDLLWYM
ncbi:DUF3888 domain-containing protein [Ornithinibacillus bavariensis]|uniref:DUF3888 domain-containing protein n=1 Tax=Ornithinibacillus bavariensis TaxID=545502 RepID=UPI000EB83E69|nr:hypothetical protein [Ornithinibacillus sp.]